MNMTMSDLIAAIQGAQGTVNVTINVTPQAPVQAEPLPATDFKVGDKVFVCHLKKDGSGTKHTFGVVDQVQQKDDKGYYTRVTGENGCHYRTGLLLNEERLGSKIVFVCQD